MNEIFNNELSQLTLYTSARGVPVEPLALPLATISLSSDKDNFGASTPLTVLQAVDANNDSRPGVYTIFIPYNIIGSNRYAKVVCSYELPGFGTIVKEEIYEVRTRLITFEEYTYMMNEDIAPERFNEFNVAETEARAVITAFCNHNFDTWSGSIEIVANPNFILLPKHLEKFTGIKEYDDFDQPVNVAGYAKEENGLALRKRSVVDKRAFQKKFIISGDWGYKILPDEVKKSAFELTRDFSSSNINDRRNYVISTGGGGIGGMEQGSNMISWKAFQDSTGNSIADALLAPYRIFNLGVI